ncbi:MAG: deoxyribodipyrimidine photo-lyase, partial [Rhodobacteraceae bacterium]|nr:deoxyribodipyrimidine photo-lyase [Paracoccaceae bacterium]
MFILDDLFQSYGAAPKWRLGLGLEHLARSFEKLSSKLILRRGDAESVLTEVIQETAATSVVWNRLYEPKTRERDSKIKETLTARGITVQSFAGMVMFEPWTVATG